MKNFSWLGKINVLFLYDRVELDLSLVQNYRNEKHNAKVLFLTALDI